MLKPVLKYLILALRFLPTEAGIVHTGMKLRLKVIRCNF